METKEREGRLQSKKVVAIAKGNNPVHQYEKIINQGLRTTWTKE